MQRLTSILGFLIGAQLIACGADEMHGAVGTQDGPSAQGLSYAVHGFVWANNPTAASYTPNSSYSYNSAGGSINVTRLGTGRYRVTFDGLGVRGGNVQAVAYGATSSRCKVRSWVPWGSAQRINIVCHRPTGTLVDSRFVVRFDRPNGRWDGRGAYVWANQPTSGSYTPSASYSWNSTGATNTIRRTGVGAYNVYLPGLAASAGSVQVTAYGGSSSHCKVASWGPSGTSQRVSVRCFDTHGSPTNTYFTMNFDGNEEVGTYDMGAYVWAHRPTVSVYTPTSAYSYNSGTINGWSGCANWLGDNTAGRYSTGRYFARHTNMPATGSSVHIGAYGTDASYCKVEGWYRHGADGVEVRARCFDASGAATNTRLVESYETNRYRGPC